MSNELFRLALRSDISTPAEAAVMLVLADAADDEGVCWPSTEWLAEATRLGRSTTLRALANLESDGFVVRRRRRAKSSVFTIDRERLTRKSQSETSRNENSRSETYAGEDASFPEVPEREVSERDFNKSRSGTVLKRTPKRTLTTSSRKTKLGYTPEFEAWWKLYPKRGSSKGSKFKASHAWDAALKVTTEAVLVAALKRYLTTERVLDGFPKDGVTWLNQRMWEDAEPDPAVVDPTDWLRGEWEAGRVKQVEERTGLHYRQPDLPNHIADRAGIEQWLRDQARKWIADNRTAITERLKQRTPA